MAVTLQKGTPVSLRKVDSGLMTVTMTWQNPSVDVDLACVVQNYSDSGVLQTATVVQALGKNFGSVQSAPYVALDHDDRSGGADASETLTINLARSGNFARLMPFAFVYEGSGWGKAGDARIVVNHPTQGEYVFDFHDRHAKHAKTVALVDMQNDGQGNLLLTRQEVYFNGFHRDLDSYYNWPRLNWVPGTKD